MNFVRSQEGKYFFIHCLSEGELFVKISYEGGGFIRRGKLNRGLRHSKIQPLRNYCIRTSGPEFFKEKLGNNKASKGEQQAEAKKCYLHLP